MGPPSAPSKPAPNFPAKISVMVLGSRCRQAVWTILLVAWICTSAHADEPSAQAIEFFESKIRPVLAEHCYSCHSAHAKELQGELLLDTRDGVLKGGESGPAIVPGNVEESLLIKAI